MKSNILIRIDAVCDMLNFELLIREKLHGFKLRWGQDIEARMDDGSLRHFRAVRVWHRSPHTDQPHKGGLRYHPLVSEEMMQDHAMEMSLKCWTMGLEWGGAKGGIAVDPSQHSPQELKSITEALVDEMDERNILGPYRDVPAPDVGTGPREMNWIRQRYAQRRRSREDARFAGVVTGKPVGYGFGGIPGRLEATGYGLVEVLQTSMLLSEMDHRKINRVAVMGFGNVGRYAAYFFVKNGFTVIAISDIHGGVYNKKGFSLIDFADKKDTRDIHGDKITNEELLQLPDAHILVPAALENVITKDNADKIQARIILEGANGPTTAEADDILNKKDIMVIPDILANAGGVTVSFFEWARNMSIKDERIPCSDRESVLKALSGMMQCATNNVFYSSKKYGVSLRMGAYILAIERVAPLFRSKHTAV